MPTPIRILNTVEMREFDCSHDVVPLDEVASVLRETKDSVEADETGFLTAAFAPSREAWRRAVPASIIVTGGREERRERGERAGAVA